MRPPHFILYVADQQTSRDFYRRVLLVEPRLHVPGMTEFELPGGSVLGLMPEASIARLIPIDTAGASRAELYLFVHDLAGVHQRAIDAGAIELSRPRARDWGDVVSYCRDPDNHILAFAQA